MPEAHFPIMPVAGAITVETLLANHPVNDPFTVIGDLARQFGLAYAECVNTAGKDPGAWRASYDNANLLTRQLSEYLSTLDPVYLQSALSHIMHCASEKYASKVFYAQSQFLGKDL